MKKPNIVYVFGDQHRAECTGYAGNPTVKTPTMDKLRDEGLLFSTSVSGCPVCCPYRASLMMGQYPLTHGVFTNDVSLYDNIQRTQPDAVTLGEAFKRDGYRTAYLGKWHLDGHGRSAYIPHSRHLGFDFWRTLECSHDYNHSPYYAQDDPTMLFWDGYDAVAQTKCAQEYLREAAGRDEPFLLMLSWGPPHNPYHTAPPQFQEMYRYTNILLRPNVPDGAKLQTCIDLAGYYAHVSALDTCLDGLLRTLDEEGLAENTIFIYTSDHGDMLGSHGYIRKQKPWDESILTPCLMRWPMLGSAMPKEVKTPFNTPDMMPTLLGLCEIEQPASVEGIDFSPMIRGEQTIDVDGTVIESIAPFGEYARPFGGKEFRGVRAQKYTYVKDLMGPWLLYDNEKDPYQLENLCNQTAAAPLQQQMDTLLSRLLIARKDEFLNGDDYNRRWGYEVDETGTVPYTN